MAALGLGPCGFELLFDLLDISSGVLQCMRRLNPARNLRLAIGTETQIADCRRAGSLRSCDSDHRRQVAALVARGTPRRHPSGPHCEVIAHALFSLQAIASPKRAYDAFPSVGYAHT